MPQKCTIDSCNRSACGTCHCCQQNICIIHLNEHNDLLNDQLNPLLESINILGNRLRALTVQNITDRYRQDIEQWRLDAHKKIDLFWEQKCQELDRLVIDKIGEMKENISGLYSTINTLIRQQQITRQDICDLSSSIDHVENEVNSIHRNFVQMTVRPLALENSSISIKGLNDQTYDLSILSSVYKIINCPEGSYGSMASNDRCLLIHQKPNLCFVDRNLEILKRVQWRHGIICDMCWSETLARFVILDSKSLYLIDENGTTLDKIQTHERRKWLSCTSSDEHLYLSVNQWGTSITKISFNSGRKLDQQWQSPNVCKKDEYVDVIRYNKRKIAMIVRSNSNQTIRFELRTAERLDFIWSLPLDLLWNPNKPFNCCSFMNEDWFIADYETGRLLHITKSGKIKSILPYNTIPYCITLFGRDTLAVSAKDGINFHNLNYRQTLTIYVV